MVDYSAAVQHDLLGQIGVEAGGRRVVSVEERASVMSTLDDAEVPSQVSPGGSLANTLVAVARLAKGSRRQLKVAMAGSMGVDTLGEYYNAQMESSGVSVLLDEQAGHTGTVISLTTPDAQRSFVSYFTSGAMQLTQRVAGAIRAARMLVIEGYLWETPNALEYIRAAASLARASGAQVVLTMGDPGVVQRHRGEILQVVADGVDMIFCNVEEALNLLGGPEQAATTIAAMQQQQQQQQQQQASSSSPSASSSSSSASSSPSSSGSGSSSGSAASVSGTEAALALGSLASVAVVTDGSRGAYITALGEISIIPPHWTPAGPVDTCGAGDAYAAGVLYALLSGHGVRASGQFAARVASSVISRFGPQLSLDDAEALSRLLPVDVSLSSLSSLGSMDEGGWYAAP